MTPNQFGRRGLAFVAPFAVDMDFSDRGGCITWQTFRHFVDTTRTTPQERTYFTAMKAIVRGNADDTFTPAWTVVVTWQNAPPYSYYRYNKYRTHYMYEEVSVFLDILHILFVKLTSPRV